MIRSFSTLAALGVLFLAACSAVSGPSSPPDIALMDGDAEAPLLMAGYCWESAGATLCADPPEVQLDAHTPYPLAAGEPLQLRLDQPLPDGLALALSEELFGDDAARESMSPAATVSWRPAVAPGDYVLTVSADWEQGEATYWYYITLN